MQQKNIDRLISIGLSTENEEAKEAGLWGYTVKTMVQATLPHKKIVGNEFTRKNGNFSLSILSPAHIGLPYGSIPRLLLSWIATEAVITKNKKLYLGESLAAFMRKIELNSVGGVRGDITRLKDQLRRLFSASISYSYDDNKQAVAGGDNFHIARKYQLWWNPKDPSDIEWESYIELDDNFFNELVHTPIPISIAALRGLKRSPLALDIYCWITYRMSYLRKKTYIPWPLLHSQFGANYQLTPVGMRHFKYEFLKELRKVKLVYPALNADSDSNSLILMPSKPHIPKSKDRPLLITL